MKLPCVLIHDLLPLYAEHLTSPETDQLLAEHLQSCPACRDELHSIRLPVPVQADAQADAPLKTIQIALTRRRVHTILVTLLVVLAVVYAATALPFTIYLLSGYFATLPHDFEEAAYIDGASYFSTMTRIIFPMAKPSIITIILFNFLSFWNEYIISMTLMSSTKAPRTLPVGLLNLMQAQQSAAQYGTMYAGLVLVMLPTLILYICVQRQLTQGMTVGGLKG